MEVFTVLDIDSSMSHELSIQSDVPRGLTRTREDNFHYELVLRHVGV